MKVSVIVPIYNTEKYIKKCVDSLCRQTHTDLEIILINDGSDDNSLGIMKELGQQDARIIVIDKKHGGLSDTKNAGLDVMTGDYVSFVDSDDWVDLDMYEIMLRQIDENKADAAYCEWTDEYSDGSSDIKGRDGSKKIILKGEEIIGEYFRNKIYLRPSSGLLSRRIVKDMRFDTNLQPGEEMLYGFLALCNAKCVVYTNTPFYHRLNRVGSISNQTDFKRTNIRRAISTDMMVEYVKKNRPQHIKLAYAYCFTFYMTTLNHIIFFKCQQENLDIYEEIQEHLDELYPKMGKAKEVLPFQVYWAYKMFLRCKALYYVIVRVYYKDIKKEFGGKRQR